MLAGKRSQSGRGYMGVGIALGLKGVRAWKDAGSVVHDGFGPCIIAIRLLVQDEDGADVGIHLVSMYRHSDWEWDDFEETRNSVIGCKKAGDVVVVGSDCNAHPPSSLYSFESQNVIVDVVPFPLYRKVRTINESSFNAMIKTIHKLARRYGSLSSGHRQLLQVLRSRNNNCLLLQPPTPEKGAKQRP